jgi:hypothetical protein
MKTPTVILKITHWVEGVISEVIHEFDKVEDAIEHSVKNAFGHHKIYDKDGSLCHSHDHDHDGHHDHYA